MGDAEEGLKVRSFLKEAVMVDGFWVFCGAKQEVLFCVFQSDEFLNRRRVTTGLEVEASECVGDTFGHALCLDPMLEQGGNIGRRC